jgi:hypothetical protein
VKHLGVFGGHLGHAWKLFWRPISHLIGIEIPELLIKFHELYLNIIKHSARKTTHN